LTADAESQVPEDEKFDFDFDPSVIAQQVDRLDAFLSEESDDEPEVGPPIDDQAEEAASGQDDTSIDREMDEPRTVTPDQIDATIERVIIEKFSGKIEGIIYEVIEKAVAREIDRLKAALTGNDTIDDNQQ
jgi:hypothetical protein